MDVLIIVELEVSWENSIFLLTYIFITLWNKEEKY